MKHAIVSSLLYQKVFLLAFARIWTNCAQECASQLVLHPLPQVFHSYLFHCERTIQVALYAVVNQS
jgi:hypothetical protein